VTDKQLRLQHIRGQFALASIEFAYAARIRVYSWWKPEDVEHVQRVRQASWDRLLNWAHLLNTAEGLYEGVGLFPVVQR
jgi:hypothetical protein